MSRERSAPERGRGVVLVGYRATGKSTVGRLLAGRLGLPFHDADPVLEARHGRPIRTIFAELGEPVFRDWEHQVLADLTAGPPCVLATGGGAVLRPENRALLRGHGFVVWLSAPPDVLAARTPLYREVADAEVATDGRTVDDVVAAVLDRVQGGGS
jgi:shikimate kinase